MKWIDPELSRVIWLFSLFALILGSCMYMIYDKQTFYLNQERVAMTQYDFIITIHGVFLDTVYYSNDPPMYGSNCVMFIDAITGLLVVEIAPRITARSTEPITKGATEKKKPRRYLLCER